MHGERRGIHAIQHNTNEPKTGEKPRYMPSGLAFCTDIYHRLGFDVDNEDTNTSGYYCYDYLAAEDARYQAMMSKYGGKVPAGEDEYNKDVHHRNNRRASNQATMNNMGMERGRMRKEPDNQSSGKATAKINRKTAAAASTFRQGQ